MGSAGREYEELGCVGFELGGVGGRSVCGGLICEILEAGEGRVVMMRYYY